MKPRVMFTVSVEQPERERQVWPFHFVTLVKKAICTILRERLTEW
jgi:hypothetical protein